MTSVSCWKRSFSRKPLCEDHLHQQLQPQHWLPLLVWVFTGTLEATDVVTHLIHSCRFISRPIRRVDHPLRSSLKLPKRNASQKLTHLFLSHQTLLHDQETQNVLLTYNR